MMTVFCRREESGFTLVELLVAVAILMLGLVAVMQWFPLGTAGVETGRRQSTGVFLAEQKVEQIKAWSLSTAANQGFTTVAAGGTCFTDPNGPCRNDALNAIPGYPEYSRTVTIANGPTATTRLVRVQVQYRRVTDRGTLTGGQQVDIATLIAQH
jgi:prepilin-type N-terminal cleavage/methylation domain-containing protein